LASTPSREVVDVRSARQRKLRPIGVCQPAVASGAAGFVRDAVALAHREPPPVDVGAAVALLCLLKRITPAQIDPDDPVARKLAQMGL